MMNPTAAAVAPFKGVNRGVYIADNLDFLRAINTGSVDLVCIDPPFAKNDTFTADKLKPKLEDHERNNELRLLKDWDITNQEAADTAGIAWPDDPRARGGYKDTWAWDKDIHSDWVDGIKATHPAVNMLIEATREIHGDGVAAYLAFMAIRLFEIHRILKPTGSLYLHCDHTASGYLRQLLDGVFGKDNLRNEIIWKYRRWTATATRFQQMHDTILWYAKGGKYVFNKLLQPYADESLIEDTVRGVVDGKLVRLKDDGGNYIRRNAPNKGVTMHDTWLDINFLPPTSKERTGYPTQKPVALAERIIQASTNPGDVVLDCFAGCAYAAVAAEKLGRQWVACDINPRAWTVFKRQFNKGGELPLLTCNDKTTGQQVMGSEPTVTVHGPGELPERTDGGGGVEVKPLRTDNRRQTERKYKRESTLLDREEMLTALLQFSNGKAWCCGYESRNADGDLALGDYELDHIIPRSVGGDDDITNRAPLCPTHNQLKRDLDLDLKELRAEVAFRRQLRPGITLQALPRADRALEYAMRVRAAAYQRKFGVARF